ncbi:MAG: hypothetical protein JM58_02605 [Peptococcaceae bacterium BICA1-8]|nr:MAG: hypothetical protein JM58_02605 [Peptococcaceae bacterium BICA1-8]
MRSILKKEQVFEEVNGGILLPRCILCKEVPKLGIAEGFLLTGQFVCSGCEQKLLTLNYDDPAYNIMVHKLKDVIYGSKKSSKQVRKE